MNTKWKIPMIGAAVTLLVLAAVAIVLHYQLKPTADAPSLAAAEGQWKTFTSEADFHQYLSDSAGTQGLTLGNGVRESLGMPTVTDNALTTDTAIDKGAVSAPSPTADRVSTTNVQIAGIDEPDSVKTNGSQLFYSTAPLYFRGDLLVKDLPSFPVGQTSILQAVPADQLDLKKTIDEGGELLLEQNTLIILENQGVKAFDISDPTNPTQSWHLDLSDNTSTITARLTNGQLYLITSTTVDSSTPCPLKMWTRNDSPMIVECGSILRPQQFVLNPVTYTTSQINPATGESLKSVSTIGSYDTVFSMSPNSIYIVDHQPFKEFSLLYQFYTSDGKDMIPDSVLQRLKTINNYDISDGSKLTELQLAISAYTTTLSSDDAAKKQTDINNAIQTYYSKHQREVDQSLITKIDRDSLTITAVGTIPGTLLNQFSIDEYKDHVRVTTTVGKNIWPYAEQSTNDLIVLNNQLDTVGSVQDLGNGEEIYSARFVGDVAYMVTFRQTDPFYVFDLSDPTRPQKTGELKIPGYSSYLHPLTDTLVLGVGEDNSHVKLSLFDISDRTNPQEISKYSLTDEYWSEAINNHHAFLQDPDKQIIFIPGGQTGNGYIMSYGDRQLSLTKIITGTVAERAVYLDNVLYILGQSKVIAVAEDTWETIKSVDLPHQNNQPIPYEY